MTNILSISFGSFKLDVPLDAISKMSATPAASKVAASAPAKPKVSAIVKEVPTLKEAIPSAKPVVKAAALPAAKPTLPKLTLTTSYSKHIQNTIRNMGIGDVFIAHPESCRKAQTMALVAARDLRNSGYHCEIATRQCTEDGMTGARIWRLR